MELKTLIISTDEIDVHSLISKLTKKDEEIKLINTFTNNIEYNDVENEYGYYYLDNKTINLSIKNNVILYINSSENKIKGITLDDFYNGDVAYMYLSDFNNISENLLNKFTDNLFIVWLDTKHHDDKKLLNRNINELNYILDKIYNYNFIYLLDETNDTISDIILEYINADEEKRKEIIEKYQ